MTRRIVAAGAVVLFLVTGLAALAPSVAEARSGAASAPPGRPSAVVATGGARQVTVTWFPPLLGGATAYQVELYQGTGAFPVRTASTPERTMTFVGLEADTTYRAAVTAIGDGGRSEPSSSNSVVTTRIARDTVDPPTFTTYSNQGLTPLDEAVEVRWQRPFFDPLDWVEYDLRVRTGGVIVKELHYVPRTIGEFDHRTVVPVEAEEVYDVQVRANFDGFIGAWSVWSNPVYPVKALAAPGGFTATPGAGSVTLSWRAPDAAGGPPIEQYRISIVRRDPTATKQVQVPASQTTYTATELEPGVTYFFRVRGERRAVAFPSNRLGAESAEVQATPRALAPPNTPNQAFVHAAYADFLSRAPNGAELAQWANRLDAGTPRATLTEQLAQSDEWLGVIVYRFYNDTLGRGPDTGGRAFWVQTLRSGRMTVAEVAGNFYGSDEYFTRIGGGRVDTWVADLYQKLLHRVAEPEGAAFWAREAGARGRSAVATQMYQSDETLGVRVESLYEKLLGRAADPGGKDFWKKQVLLQGDISLALQLAASDEYFTKAAGRYP